MSRTVVSDDLLSMFLRSAWRALMHEDAAIHQEAGPTSAPILGLWDVPEVALMYLIRRELVRSGFPLTVIQEPMYDSQNSAHRADLAICENKRDICDQEDPEILAYVEFKFWRSDDSKEVLTDIEKLYRHGGSRRKFFLAYWFNETSEQVLDGVQWLEKKVMEQHTSRYLHRVGPGPLVFPSPRFCPQNNQRSMHLGAVCLWECREK